jgi:protease IV
MSDIKDPQWQLLEKLVMQSSDEARKARRWGIFFKSITFLYLFALIVIVLRASPGSAPVLGGDSIVGLVRIEGLIVDDSQASASTINTGLRRAFEDDRTKAVILSINSPGGTPVQAGYVYDEIVRLRAKYPDKKVYAVISDTGASGAYYIAAAADQIYADKASLIGSIGVISMNFGFVDAIKKLGIERRVYSAGKNKAFMDPYQEVPEEHRQYWQGVLATTHQQFIDQVRKGRGDRLKDSEELFSGLIWPGETALGLGLIDGLGGASYVAREIVKVEDIVDFSVKPNPIEKLVNQLGVSIGEGVAGSLGVEGMAQLRFQ